MSRSIGTSASTLNPLNAKVRAIARREYMQRVRSKWFLFTTLGLPVLMGALALLSGWLVTREGEEVSYQVGVVDRSERAAELVVDALEREAIVAAALPEFAALPADSLAAALRASGFNLLVVIPENALGPLDSWPGPDAIEVRADATGGWTRGTRRPRDNAGPAGWMLDQRSTADGPPVLLLSEVSVGHASRRAIREAVNRGLMQARLQEMGLTEVDASALLLHADLNVVSVTSDGARSQEAFQIISFVLALVFYMVLLVYGQMIVRSILEEKTSDIVEVMVSSVRPRELMMGKIIGVGAVGLTQVAIWLTVVVGLAVTGMTGAMSALAEAGLDMTGVRVPVGLIVGILLFLVLGYLLYAGLFAGTGATLSRDEDAQQASLPVIVLIVLPFIMAQGVIEHPDSALSVGLSMVPFFSPLLMPSRMLVTAVPAWQLVLSILLLLACILLVAWLAGRIYRVGILMKGKRPNLPELMRWVRHG